jgi:hypothetical protein
MKEEPPIQALPGIEKLQSTLMDLLDSMTLEDWSRQTVARQWKVKDVVAHLLDGNIRSLSMLRDDWRGEANSAQNYEELVAFLNRLNAEWVMAMKRVSPVLLRELHALTGPMYVKHLQSLSLWEPATFPVAWAGEAVSCNWMHIAREYTEKWLHQQQIRHALGDHAMLEEEEGVTLFFRIFMLGLPATFRGIVAQENTRISIQISGLKAGAWKLTYREKQWHLKEEEPSQAEAGVIIPKEWAWQLFSKSLHPSDVKKYVEISGDSILAHRVLEMVSVMA